MTSFLAHIFDNEKGVGTADTLGGSAPSPDTGAPPGPTGTAERRA